MADRPPLLFLAHRIPYPPNKGDKIRSFHILKHLSEHFSIYLGTFVDDKNDWQYCPVVRSYCEECFFVERKPRLHKLLATRGFLSNEALSVTFYRSAAMQRWVDHSVTQHEIKRALLFCSPMAQFLSPGAQANTLLDKIVIDFVDVDSEKWGQYAESSWGFMQWLYGREGQRLLEWERGVVSASDQSFFVSENEAQLFGQRTPDSLSKVDAFSNGVDTEFFSPAVELPNPYPTDAFILVFTGAMDYRPNIDGVFWFVKNVLPTLTLEYPLLQLWVVGSNPGSEIRSLGSLSNVEVTGRVADIRPYLQYAHVAIAPMQIARGVQNKVLEAMAMGTVVMASPQATVGIPVTDGENLLVCERAGDFSAGMSKLEDTRYYAKLQHNARSVIEQQFSWNSRLLPLFEALA